MSHDEFSQQIKVLAVRRDWNAVESICRSEAWRALGQVLRRGLASLAERLVIAGRPASGGPR